MTSPLWPTIASGGLTLTGTLAGVAGVWHAARTKARAEAADAERDDDRDEARLDIEQWRALLEEQRVGFETLLGPMKAEIATLNVKVATLEAALANLDTRYRIAVAHIRATHRWADGDRAAPLPPRPPPHAHEG